MIPLPQFVRSIHLRRISSGHWRWCVLGKPPFWAVLQHLLDDLVKNFLAISLQAVRAAATIQWQNRSWGRQASYLLSRSILTSLDDTFHTQLVGYQSDYSMTVPPNHERSDAALLLKLILNWSLHNPQATRHQGA
jgi:hypothetical protein